MKSLIKNKFLVHFSDGQKIKYETTATIPEIKNKFSLGKVFILTDRTAKIRVKALTIG